VFEKFNDRSRRAVVMAQDEARALRHDYIGTEHLLLGILREGGGVAAQVLEDAGVRLDTARAGVTRITGQGSRAPEGILPFTVRAKKAIRFTVRQADLLGHDYVGTEHLLLGLADEGDGVAARVLAGLDAGLLRLRERVIGQLHAMGLVASASCWQLLALPSVAGPLEADLSLVPAGTGSVCFRAPGERSPGMASPDILAILRESRTGAARIALEVDNYGFTWATFRQDTSHLDSLVNSLRSVNLRLTEAGHDASLLCSVVAFGEPGKRQLMIIYLNRRGTFYPFAPIAAQQRDNALELDFKDLAKTRLPIESDLGRWFPVWDAPVLRGA
jgi:PspAB-like protein/ClpA/ClpB-like protein